MEVRDQSMSLDLRSTVERGEKEAVASIKGWMHDDTDESALKASRVVLQSAAMPVGMSETLLLVFRADMSIIVSVSERLSTRRGCASFNLSCVPIYDNTHLGRDGRDSSETSDSTLHGIISLCPDVVW